MAAGGHGLQSVHVTGQPIGSGGVEIAEAPKQQQQEISESRIWASAPPPFDVHGAGNAVRQIEKTGQGADESRTSLAGKRLIGDREGDPGKRKMIDRPMH